MSSQTLSTLVKLHTHEVDTQRRAVAELEEALARMQEALANHLQLIETQKQAAAADFEAARALPDWIREAINHVRKLEQQVTQLESWIDDGRAELQRRFAELKKYEIAHQNEIDRARAEAGRVEQIMLDEVAGQRAARQDD